MTGQASGDVSPPLSWRAIALLIAGGLVTIGSFGPWARVFIITVDGTDGDGALTLILGLIATVVALIALLRPSRRLRSPITLFVCFGLSALIGVLDWSDLSRVAEDEERVAIEVGWGLVVMTLAAAAGAILSLSRLADVFLENRHRARLGDGGPQVF